MLIAARLFSMKYAARRCRTFKPLIAFSFCSEECSPAIWPGPFGNLRAAAAQVHGVAQAGLRHGFRYRIALPLLVLPGFRRRRHQVRRARTAEGFGERSRIAHVGRERFRALAYKTVQSPQVAP